MFCLFLSIMLVFSLSFNIECIEARTVSPTIELHDFRWNRFPLKVLIEMNEWSTPAYVQAVRGALDSWVKSIWNYTHTYTNQTLVFTYLFYLSNVNATSTYDVVISFSQHEFGQNMVGLTTMKWNPVTHEPVKPIPSRFIPPKMSSP